MVFELIIFGTLHFPILHQDVIIRRDSLYFASYKACNDHVMLALDDLAREAQSMSRARKQFAKADYYIYCKALPGQRLTSRRGQGPA